MKIIKNGVDWTESAIIRDKKDWVDNPDFIYLRIDKNSQIRDVNKFYDEEIKPQLNSKVSNKFKILGKNARSNVIQNNFNALVLRLKGWSSKDICTHKNIYLRKTDEVDGNSRTVGERLTVSKDKSGSSAAVTKYSTFGNWLIPKRNWVGLA